MILNISRICLTHWLKLDEAEENENDESMRRSIKNTKRKMVEIIKGKKAVCVSDNQRQH